MVTARTVLLLALLLSCTLCCATAHRSPTECCYEYAQRPVRYVQRFYHTPSDCTLPAVVVVAATGDEICANPKKPWVRRAMATLRRKK